MRMVSPAPQIRCRQIGEADIAAVAMLLTRGFPNREREFWQRALERLKKHRPPAGLPQYGYLMESGGVAVGAVLLICSTMPTDGAADAVAARCNLSSWYVEPAFRTYATLLVSHALRHKDVTYLNVSPAPHTVPIIEAQGFSRYCDGVVIAFPILNGWFAGASAKVFGARQRPTVSFDPHEREILLRHAEHGCISLWCATSERAYPFVFRPRLVKGFIPFAQLIYSHDVADFARFAGPIGRYLARRGKPFVIVDSNGPIPGLAGTFRRGSMPKYFKGPQRPRLGDLAYTEYAVLGI
jgi:hypothetical protein